MNSSCDNNWNREQYKSVIFNQGIEPHKNSGYKNLNHLQRSMEYTRIENKGIPNCSKVLYYKQDPRLIDPRRGANIFPISEPPLTGNEPFIPNNFEAKIYKNYGDIKSGQITYYVDKSIEKAFFNPNFVNGRNVTSYVYVDPMNNVKPHYERETSYADNQGYCLSWMRDSQEQREDIVSKQMSRINQNRFDPVYSGLNK